MSGESIIRSADPFASALRYAHSLRVPAYITREGQNVIVARCDGTGVRRTFAPETHHELCCRLIATMEIVNDALTIDRDNKKRGAR